ncbi:phytanoyl-CoA dioxygenase family protein [Kribbella sp. VKM Ac-2566]|uniref:phytanoyl-CoA dioxygenase family protein n=1 Tax=Kribbella sp. VKM Ac-2566 TaxID=2512218 RepID=UPI00106367F3|nr:phytanoyl-CoA dioxygenase family protein [Kribbella sp. VKM Ac-2566]TDX02719.1 phytanoyl-CoA dioxygenase PhyH [Kribbella sp. VKM Ac-2566]
MRQLTEAQRTQFRNQGYVVVPGVLTDDQIAAARRIVGEMLERQPPEGVGAHFLWPALDGGHPLLALYRAAGIAELAAQLLRPELELLEPDQAQVATTIPPWPHRPGGPHVDGITPGLEDGTPGTFTMLAGLWLTSHEELDRGNLYLWPGTHLRFGEYLADRGADALSRVDEMNPGPYPDIPLGDPIQATGAAGSVLFAHYLLAHNIGGHSGSADDVRRETLYYRLRTTTHRANWRAAVTDPLLEFRP